MLCLKNSDISSTAYKRRRINGEVFYSFPRAHRASNTLLLHLLKLLHFPTCLQWTYPDTSVRGTSATTLLCCRTSTQIYRSANAHFGFLLSWACNDGLQWCTSHTRKKAKWQHFKPYAVKQRPPESGLRIVAALFYVWKINFLSCYT